MADFAVPNYSDLINNLNPQIAAGPPKFDFSAISNALDNYNQGGKIRQEIDARNLFQNGLPSNPADLISALAKNQGAAAAPQIMQYYKMLFGQDAAQGAEGSPGQPAAPPSASNPMPRPVAAGGPVPSTPRVMGYDEGVKKGLYDPPETPGGLPPIQPDAQAAMTPNQRVAQGFPSSTALVSPEAADPTLGGLVPAGRTPMQQRDFLTRKIGSGMLDPEMVKNFQSRIDAIDKALDQYRQGNVNNSQTTPEQKNARASGAASPLEFDTKKKVQEANVAAGTKQYEGIQAQSTQYERDLKPYLDVSRSITNDPSMYSGIGGQLSLDFNRVKAALGDKNAAVLQEALSKVTAASVLAQINNQRAQLQEAGGQSSRIFRQQVELVEKAAPSLANTPAGNRFLIEVASRMGDLSTRVADLARQYKQQNGYLDHGFDAQLSGYMKQNPVFTQQELTHPETLGAPSIPPQYAGNPSAFSQWVKGMGLKSGDAIRLPNGTLKAIP